MRGQQLSVEKGTILFGPHMRSIRFPFSNQTGSTPIEVLHLIKPRRATWTNLMTTLNGGNADTIHKKTPRRSSCEFIREMCSFDHHMSSIIHTEDYRQYLHDDKWSKHDHGPWYKGTSHVMPDSPNRIVNELNPSCPTIQLIQEFVYVRL
mmetsp:Transcript_4136/g.15569  ORF Transcript_4136/g.15569 Transcript_4136/m.15569 type:complete len:150 (-) Transcript_4136:463-912(-)